MFEFIETPLFAKALEHYLDDDESARRQFHLNAHPEAGHVVPGSGGVRKLMGGGGARETRWVARYLLPAKRSG